MNFEGFLFSLRGLIVALIVAAIWLTRRPSSRAARRFLLIAAASYTLASIYIVPYAIGRLFVAGYRPLAAGDIPAGRIAIAVLNSGNEFVEAWDGGRFAYSNQTDAARLWETYRVYRLATDAWVVTSEGAVKVRPDAQPSGLAKRDFLVHLGVPPSRIVTDLNALSTHDEAVHLVAHIRPLAVERIVLVTSDTHMRRSIAAFRAEGVEAIPAIARDPELTEPWAQWLLPGNVGLRKTQEVVHELVGIPWYSLRGWAKLR